MLKQGQDERIDVIRPWLIILAKFTTVAVLSFNFLGNGLRDAADPYTRDAILSNYPIVCSAAPGIK